MNKLYKPDLTSEDIKPADGKKFTLKELQKMVGGYIEVYPIPSGKGYIICNENGINQGLPPNEYVKMLFGIDLVGNVALVDNECYN